jgi:hypothetical protein
VFRHLHNPCLVMNARGGVNHHGLITTAISVRRLLLTMLITFSFCGGLCSASSQFGFPGSHPAFQHILQNTLCRIVNKCIDLTNSVELSTAREATTCAATR